MQCAGPPACRDALALTNQPPAARSPSSDAQEHRRTLARNGLRLPYHERIRLKKIAQRRRRRHIKGKGKTIRIATCSMAGRGQEVVDFMERRKVNIMCVHETKWKGSKVKELGNGFKLFYIGEDGRRKWSRYNSE